MLPARLGAHEWNTQKGVAFQHTGVRDTLEIYSYKQDAYTIDLLSRRLLGI